MACFSDDGSGSNIPEPRRTSNSFKQLNRGLVSNSVFKQSTGAAGSPSSSYPSPRASRFTNKLSYSAMTPSSSNESVSSSSSSTASFRNAGTALGLGLGTTSALHLRTLVKHRMSKSKPNKLQNSNRFHLHCLHPSTCLNLNGMTKPVNSNASRVNP